VRDLIEVASYRLYHRRPFTEDRAFVAPVSTSPPGPIGQTPLSTAPSGVRAWYSGYVLTVLGLISVLNYYDRNLITILVEPVKRDLHLSDADIGLLSGIGFALMYSVLGIPMARLADRYGRARLLAATLGVWSLMTFLSGRAINFTTMLLGRVGVAVGEAGGLPATHALVADYFSAARRGMALSVIGICGALGITLALAGGGLISDWRGWRVAFYVGGLPGLLLAGVVFFTVRETVSTAPLPSARQPAIKLRIVFATLWHRRSYVHLCAGLGIAAIGAYGQFAWTPAFLMRSYHLSAGRVGSYYSAVVGPAQIISIFIGGALNDWLLKRDRRWPLWLLAFCFGVNVPASLIFFLVHNFALAMVMTLVTTVVGSLWVAPSYAIVQNLAGPQFRAMAAAIFMMIVNIVGLGLGPYATGLLSDALAPRFGDRALAVSLCLITITCGIGIVNFLLGTRTVAMDMDDAATVTLQPGRP
jgi:MFS family permease